MTEGVEVAELPKYDLANFQVLRILSNNTRCKTISLLGKFADSANDDKAVIILEKTAFSTDPDAFFSDRTSYKTEFINNIYGNFEGIPPGDINKIKVTVVYPATQKHIEKYSVQERHLVLETPSLYEHVTEPYIQSAQFSLDWVYNILEHRKEQERIIFEDDDPKTGFILLPDLKWDGRSVETLYVLAIVHDRTIKSLRDLTKDHLPLLKNIQEKGLKAIEKSYNILADQLRVYIHYQPSFYHFHVHFNALNGDAPGISCEKSHLIHTVINNIELVSDYYKKATLPFALHDSTLFEKFQEEETHRKRIKLS